MDTQSEKLKRLTEVQIELEDLEKAKVEAESTYLRKANVNFALDTKNYNSKLGDFNVLLDRLSFSQVIELLIGIKTREYNDIFQSLGFKK